VRAAFLDRDGVINVDHGYVSRIEEFDFIEGVLAASADLARQGFALVVVTNQAGIGRGMYGEADFELLTAWMRERFSEAGAPLAGVYHCPHHPTLALGAMRTVCDCRKPAPGMLLQAARELLLDLTSSVIFGDKCDDMRAGLAAGVGLRIFLGKDGLELPSDDCADGQVDLRFASLAQALASPDFHSALSASGDARRPA
jgi:D-glycero-D-manno-heptose 1,7-bisphosphate phosphatase